jgi:thiamine biosynthesis lipoprotein
VTAGVRFPAIGTTAHLLVAGPAALPAAELTLRGLLADLDLACSRFRPDSALSLLNAHGGPLAVHPLLVEALRVALRAAAGSDGVVVPTLGRALVAIGYDRDFADVPASSDLPVIPQPAGDASADAWRRIEIDGDVVTLPAGVHLDLGATAKAWAADVAAERIAAETGCGVLVNLGGDLAVAGPARSGGWRVRLAEHHADVSGAGPVVAVRSGGLATSSTAVRRWQRAGVPLHHVLDPRTGLPAVPVWNHVTVAAASCVDANTAATTAVVLGTAAPAWLADRNLPARLVATDGTVITVAGWPHNAPDNGPDNRPDNRPDNGPDNGPDNRPSAEEAA